MTLPSSVAAAVEKMFDLPVEVVTSWARLLLACVGLFALVVGGHKPAPSSIIVVLLLAYIAFAVIIVIARSSRALSHTGAYVIHAVDVTVSSALMLLTAGTISPFFVFYQFTLITATLRWDWAGALITAGILTTTLWLFQLTGFSPSTAASSAVPDNIGGESIVIRDGFLMISGAMLAYMGAYRERARRRFAKLAAWPQVGEGTKIQLIETALSYSADVMRTHRLLVIWDEVDEPYRHVALWAEGELRYSRETTNLFGDLVSASHRDRTFVFVRGNVRDVPAGASGQDNSLLDRVLTKTFKINSAATSPFIYATCRGRVFVLDRTAWSEEDLSVVSVIAGRIGGSLEDHVLRDKLQAAAAFQERTRLGRDLHDGVLQGLAAASINLKIISLTLPPESQEQLRNVRDVLADEAQRIRNFVEANRARAALTTGLVPLRP